MWENVCASVCMRSHVRVWVGTQYSQQHISYMLSYYVLEIVINPPVLFDIIIRVVVSGKCWGIDFIFS